MTEPRGIRNRNPMNLKHLAANKWQGLADPPADDGGFCIFDDALYGIRAGALNLVAYYDRYDLDTISKIVARWAPYSENDVGAYVRSVCSRSGFAADETLDLHSYEHLAPLVEAMIWHENGRQPYTTAQLDKALTMAGVPPPAHSLQRSRTVRGGQVAIGGIALSGLAEALRGAAAEMQPLLAYADELRWAFLALSVIGIAAMLWARIDDRAKGLR